MAEESIPNWIGHTLFNQKELVTVDARSIIEWNTVVLGDVTLPGYATIKGLNVGIDVETKKAKGSDQWTSKDNGLDKSDFKIELQVLENQWFEFQATFTKWNPRRPGRERGPVDIINPFVNNAGIKSVRIISVEMDSPTAKSGLLVTISCEEWFDKPKETKATDKKSKQARPTTTAEEYQAALTYIEQTGDVPKDQQIPVGYDPATGRMKTIPGARLGTALKERGIQNKEQALKAALWQ